MKQLQHYRKTIAAVLGVLSTWVTTALADGHVSAIEVSGLAAALLGVFGVYQAVYVAKPKATAARGRRR